MGGNGVVKLHASLVLFLIFVNFCLTKKKKEKENCCQSRKFFSLQINCFLVFVKVLNAKFVPKITIHESFCQKFRDFLISQKFLLSKVSAPKVAYPETVSSPSLKRLQKSGNCHYLILTILFSPKGSSKLIF